MATMRAVRVHQFGGPEVLKVENVPVPRPEEGQVLIRVKSVGVNPYDTYVRSGIFGPKDFPYTPGGDAAGIVEQVGAGVTEFKPGDRVYTSGTLSGSYAEMAVSPARYTSALGDNLSFAQGASIGVPYNTAYKALHIRAKAAVGDIVLVHGGSGAVGVAAIQAAKDFGLKVLATAGTQEGLALMRRLGADAVFCHREEGYTDKIKEFTEGKGVDVILEMLADVNLTADLDLLAFRGRVVVIGSRGTVDNFNPAATMLKETSVMGIALMMVVSDSEWDTIKAGVEEGQRSGWLRPVVGKEYPLDQVSQAHHDVINKSSTSGKLVLTID